MDILENKIKETLSKKTKLEVEHKNLSEDEAFKKLRKMAMENNKRLGQVAKDIITVFDALE